jgi:hypothetical protein
MITTYCRDCGAGPMDLPGDEICDECRTLARAEDPSAYEEEDELEYDEQP